MMRDMIRMTYAYNNWANERILDTCSKLTQEQFLAGEGISIENPSIRDTLVHMLGTQELWLARFNGVSPTSLLESKDFGTLDLIRQYWYEVEAHTQGYIDHIEDDVLQEVLHYKNLSGKDQAYPRWQAMLQLANHATQHRSEVALLLTRLGYSPGDLDMIVYMNANKA